MKLHFSKMQGLGNDFVVLDAVRQTVALDAADIRAIADRHFGIGCDQVLIVRPPRSAEADFSYQVFNGSGGEVEHCGNGARCFARFVAEQGLSERTELRVDTVNRRLVLLRQPDGRVSVDMGAPQFDPAQVPMRSAQSGPQHVIEIDGAPVTLTVLSMGNPHAVQRVESVAAAPVAELGPRIEHHPAFPQQVNAGFMEVVGRRHIRLRVWERGAGETLACGTGACAAVVAGITHGWLDHTVDVDTRGGQLSIEWAGNAQPVRMTGDARTSFTGSFDPATLIRNRP